VEGTMKKLMALFVLTFLITSNHTVTAQEWAKTKLEKSQRHLEWVEVKQGDRTIKCFIAYPEAKKPTPVVLVIHEIFGLSDWVRELCDELAAEGYIAIAPDLLSGKAGESTASHGSVDDVRKAVSGLPQEQVAEDLKAVTSYVSKLPSANGKLAVAGFCWGGAKTWLAMTTNPSFKAGFCFYGIADNSLDLSKINAPVYGFYAEKDARVGSTIADTIRRMKEAGKKFEPVTYANAGHGFMRAGEEPNAEPANTEARDKAFLRMKDLLQKI